MKKIYLLFFFSFYISIISAQQTWKKNIGIDGGGWWGLSGMSSLQKSDNPLLTSDLNNSYSYCAGLYVEFLKTRTRTDTKWGANLPGFGIKTKLDWEFFEADDGGDESIGLNYIDIPVLFEYCISFHEGVTTASYTPQSSTTTIYDHPDYSHIITTTTPGHYNPGGAPTSKGIFIYTGPQMCFLFKSYHDVGSTVTEPISDANIGTSYFGLVFGFTFWVSQLNIDLSYQQGLQSIYATKDIYINGFFCRIGLNFGHKNRLFNQ